MKKTTRIIAISILLMIVLGRCEQQKDVVLTNNVGPAYSYLKLNQVKPQGWLNDVIQTEAEGFSGHLDEFAPEIMRKPFIDPKVPVSEQRWVETWWDGESAGNWWDGLVRLAFVSGDEALIKKSEKWINHLIENQQKADEPYIGVYPEKDSTVNRWGSVIGELWPQSRAYLAMLAYYEATGNQEVLDALVKAADLTISHFHKSRNDLDSAAIKHINTHALMIVEPMLQLYQITEEEKYLAFSSFIYNKLDYFNRALLKGELYQHGVHVCENIRIPAMLYSYNHQRSLLDFSEKGMLLIMDEYLNAVGGIRSDEMVAYAKPNRASEYCTFTEWVLSTTEMAMITGNMRYACQAEKCFFNAAMGARLPNGKGIQYLSFPNQLNADAAYNHQVAYGPNHFPLCCNPNATRLFPYFVSRMWMKAPNSGLAAVLYGPCEVNARLGVNKQAVTISEKTNYPFSDKIQFTISSKAPVTFPLSLRIPVWCKNPEIMINNETLTFEVNKRNTVVIKRKWQPEDKITLIMPMNIQVDHRKTELVSVSRGPLVYALEIPSSVNSFNEVAPGFNYKGYFPKDGFNWNVALYFDNDNPAASFSLIKQDISDNANVWTMPTYKIKVDAQPIVYWEQGGAFERNNQPPVPLSPVYKFIADKDKIKPVYLVPFGITRLRITCFPYFLKI